MGTIRVTAAGRKCACSALAAAAVLVACALVLHSCSDSSVDFRPFDPEDSTDTEQIYGYRVLGVYPHDADAFTQGLVYHGGFLYEGTGLYGRSSIRRVELETGSVFQRLDLDNAYFGEGITIFGDRIVQITWREETGFVYDRATFEPLDTFSYDSEGWGITHNDTFLIMSDGMPELRFLDPADFTEVRTVEVKDAAGPVCGINELEYIQGEIYANIWQTDRIAVISPQTGRVTAWIDLERLLPPEDSRGAGVLNGIAYDAAGGRFFVTGKFWPKLFEIELVPE